MRLVIEHRDGVLRLPRAALLMQAKTGAEQALAWRLAHRRLDPVPLTLGTTDDEFVEVRGSALAEGDEVVSGIDAEGGIHGNF